MTMTIEDIQNINCSMLGLGAPVVIDGAGYNKNHYGFMSEMYAKGAACTVNQQIAMIKILLTYSNTQLTAYKDDLKDTMTYLQSEDCFKSLNKVSVVKYDSDTVYLNWRFNKNVSEMIKSSDRNNFQWFKDDNGRWILKLYWGKEEEYIDCMRDNGLDVSDVIEAKKKAQEVVLKDKDGNTIEFTYELNVERPNDSIDTLTLKVAHNPMIATAIKSVPYVSYNASKQMYTFRIDCSSKMYESLENCGKKIDLSELKPWKDLVDSWNKSYDMIDISKTDIPFKPYDFQVEDIKEMLQKRVVLNANDMGCGKTMESVITGESMPMKKLVICPPTLRLNWQREIKMINSKSDVTVLYNDSDFHTSMWTIIGYSSLAKFQNELEEENFQCIFVDEAHYCQAINNSGTPDSIRARVALRLCATAGYVYPLTGTPKTNRNKNLFNILRMIRSDLAKGQWAFMDYGKVYCEGQRNAWGWDFEGNSNDYDLNSKLKPMMIRHLKKEVLPNLKKQRMVIPVSVDLREYNYEIAEYLKNRESKEAEQLARLMRARLVLAKQKVVETIDFAKDFTDQNQKVVIVTCFTEVVKAVEEAFKGNVVKIVGGMSDAQKEAAKDEFQNGSAQVMVMNIIAGGVGITLTRSHVMIFNDYDFVIGNITQAEDRICRSGQSECCMIYYITAQGADVEENFVDMLTYKSDTISSVVDGENGEVIDFRTLVEKSAERKHSDRSMVTTSSVDQKNDQESKINDFKNIDCSKMTNEQIENKIVELGGTPKMYDNEGIYRMRLVMQLKKLMA